MLFHSRYDSSNEVNECSQIYGIRPCTSASDPRRPGRKCDCCDLLEVCQEFKFNNCDVPFEIRSVFTCETRSCLYALTCDGCGDNYIGKTDRTVRQRIGEHRRAIESGQFKLGVHKHIAECGGGVFSVAPFYKIKSLERGPTLTLAWEDFYIGKMKPRLNSLKL